MKSTVTLVLTLFIFYFDDFPEILIAGPGSRNSSAQDMRQCYGLCGQQRECHYWSWQNDTNTCTTMTDFTRMEVNKAGMVGSKQCPSTQYTIKSRSAQVRRADRLPVWGGEERQQGDQCRPPVSRRPAAGAGEGSSQDCGRDRSPSCESN